MTPFADRLLTCRDCQSQFTFSAREQEFFQAKGLVNDPKRCPGCRLIMRFARDGKDRSHTYEVACAECSTLTRVPFQPKGHKPVYCVACFHKRKQNASPETLEEQQAET